MKKLDLDLYANEVDVQVCKATLTILDRRTGEMEDKVFYRFGGAFPFERVGKELAQFGYDVIGYKDSDIAVGVLNTKVVFDTYQMMEAS